MGKATKLVTSLSQDLYKQPQLSFYETHLPFKKWSMLFNTEVKFFDSKYIKLNNCLLFIFHIWKVRLLNRDLPENINILTLEPKSDGNFLLRLEHTFDDDPDKKEILSLPVVVPLKVQFVSGFLHDERAHWLRLYMYLLLKGYTKWFFHRIDSRDDVGGKRVGKGLEAFRLENPQRLLLW